MSKRNSAPTMGWVMGSQLYKFLAGLFILNLLFWLIAIWTIKYAVARDCNDYYDRKINIGNYWINIKAGSTKIGCPNLNK